jgi:hypothetical protein
MANAPPRPSIPTCRVFKIIHSQLKVREAFPHMPISFFRRFGKVKLYPLCLKFLLGALSVWSLPLLKELVDLPSTLTNTVHPVVPLKMMLISSFYAPYLNKFGLIPTLLCPFTKLTLI